MNYAEEFDRLLEQVLGKRGPMISVHSGEVTVELDRDPEEMTDEELLDSLDDAIAKMAVLYRSAGAVKWLVGILLNEVYRRKHIWKDYVNFHAFMRDRLVSRLNMSVSALYEARKVARAWPNLDPEEVAEVGISKLVVLARVTGQDKQGWEKMLEKAKQMTYDQLCRYVNNELHDDGVRLVLVRLPSALVNEIRALARIPEVVAIVGSSDIADIIQAAIAEARSSWGV